jgi:hypothetical protein
LKQAPDFLTLICSVEAAGLADALKAGQLGEAVRPVVDEIRHLGE